MKKSEELKIEAQQEENDLVYLGKMKKVFREERLEKFEAKWIDKLKSKGYEVENVSDGKFLIRTTTKYGNVEYFPKANRIFVKLHAKQNNKGWYSKGLNWITERLLK